MTKFTLYDLSLPEIRRLNPLSLTEKEFLHVVNHGAAKYGLNNFWSVFVENEQGVLTSVLHSHGVVVRV